jgi:NADPH:quinone reductase-like Zn-dependent oxidoreductase
LVHTPDIEFERVDEKCDFGPPTRGMTMKVAFIERHGGPEVLKFGEMLDPVAASGEVVVDIVAASVNGADWKVRQGKSGQLSKISYFLGRDFSGVVSAVGEGVRDLGIGDEVFAVCDVGQEGAYAEKIAIKAAIVAKKPDSLSHVDAAALSLAGLTAICAIEGTLKTAGGRDDPDPGRSGRCRELCHPAGKTSGCSSDHDGKRVKP